MGVFIFLFAILFLLYVSTTKKQYASRDRLWLTVFCTLLLVCIQGLRHETIGVDSYRAYRHFFESVSGGFATLLDKTDYRSTGFEPGFVFLTKLIKTLNEDTQFYIFTCSALSIIPIAYLIYKYADNIPFAFIIFSSLMVYHFGFSGIRQFLAIGLTAISFDCVTHKRLLWFIVFVLFAASVHSSAILFLLAYPLYHKLHLSLTKMLFVVLGVSLCFIFLESIVLGLTKILFGGEKYMGYVSNTSVKSYNLMLLFAGLLFFTYLTTNKRVVPLRSMILLAVVFQSTGLISTTASRMSLYFIPYISLALPMTTNTIKNKGIIELIWIAFFIFFYFYANAGGYLEVIPYKFFWE